MLLGIEGEGRAYLSNVRSAFLRSVPEMEAPLDELAVVAGALEELGCRILISAAMVRNFEYYTGPAFQLEAAGRRVGGGGRYDALVSLIGDRPAPASGFALEAGLLAGLLQDEEPRRRLPATVVAPATASGSLASSFRLAAALRERGLAVQVAGSPRTAVPRGGLGEAFCLCRAGRARKLDSGAGRRRCAKPPVIALVRRRATPGHPWPEADAAGLNVEGYGEAHAPTSASAGRTSSAFREKDIPIQIALGNYDPASAEWPVESCGRFPPPRRAPRTGVDVWFYVAAAAAAADVALGGRGLDASEYPNIAEAFALARPPAYRVLVGGGGVPAGGRRPGGYRRRGEVRVRPRPESAAWPDGEPARLIANAESLAKVALAPC
jgi:hypothetical protein